LGWIGICPPSGAGREMENVHYQWREMEEWNLSIIRGRGGRMESVYCQGRGVKERNLFIIRGRGRVENRI
jgi:hypothetical protein